MQRAEGLVEPQSTVQPEVQKYLEAVFAVAPFPEEYVRYRLHLATALPLPLIDAWFEDRRAAAARDGDLRLAPEASREADGQPGIATGLGRSPAAAEPGRLPALGGAEERPGNGAHAGGAGGSSRRKRGAAPVAEEGPRFCEADLEAISNLVGLQVITSTQSHAGSNSLYLFEQLTALDSLEDASNKRRRTRHQHFWRNTDKLDASERVYIPIASVNPALRRRQPVAPKPEISAEERSNAWTVCLTARGVVSYLNKRISPLGVRMIRALQRGGEPPTASGWPGERGVGSCSPYDQEEDSLSQPRSPRVTRAAAAARDWGDAGGSSSAGEPENGESGGEAWERWQHLAAASTLGALTAGGGREEPFVPRAPRARRRKPA